VKICHHRQSHSSKHQIIITTSIQRGHSMAMEHAAPALRLRPAPCTTRMGHQATSRLHPLHQLALQLVNRLTHPSQILDTECTIHPMRHHPLTGWWYLQVTIQHHYLLSLQPNRIQHQSLNHYRGNLRITEKLVK
jgi:hypothetical protein